jgi:succinoglycan biosynthesis transport protein ExoP
MNDEAVADQSLTQYFQILARRKWWIVGVTVHFVAVAAIASSFQVRKYTATAQVLAQNTSELSTLNGAQETLPLGTDQLATYVQLATSPSVSKLARKTLGTASAARVSVSVIGTTDLIALTATSTKPAEAALVANAYAAAFADYERQIATSQANSLVKSYTFDSNKLDQELSKAQSQNNSSAEIAIAAQEAQIAQDLALAEAAAANPVSAITLVSPAPVPRAPSSPKPVRDALLGFLLGLLLGLGLAIALDYLDDKVVSPADIQRLGEVPVLASVPMVESWKKRKDPLLISLIAPGASEVESYWSLRASLRFLAQERTIRSVVVTSPAEGEGKTVTTANLGVVLAHSGQRTIVVSCDLRRPRLGSFFKGNPSIGLTSVLRGEVALEDAVQPVPGVPELFILDTGPLPPDPHRALADEATERMFQELSLNFETVLIDSPPLLPVADALVLGQITDATVVIASCDQTRSRQLKRAFEMLETAHIPLVGVILNEVTGRSQYYTYYGYGESSYREPERRKAVHRREHSGSLPLSSLNGYTDASGANPAHGVEGNQVPIYEREKWRTMADQSEGSG